MKKIILSLLVFVFLVSFATISLAAELKFSESPNQTHKLENGLIVKYCFIVGKENRVSSVGISITNTSNQIKVIKWGESNFTCGSFSGIPFLEGMKYINAGNPSATPDRIIPPGSFTVETLEVMPKLLRREWYSGWVDFDNVKSLQIALSLKITDQDNNAKYYYLPAPQVEIKN